MRNEDGERAQSDKTVSAPRGVRGACGRRDNGHPKNTGFIRQRMPIANGTKCRMKMEWQIRLSGAVWRQGCRRPSTKKWRGSGLAALMRRAQKAAGAGGPPQKNGGAAASLPSCDARTRPPVPAALHKKMEGQQPRCPRATRAQGRRSRRPSTKKWRGSGLAALMRRAHKAAGAGGPPQKMEGQQPRCPRATRAQGRRGRRPSKKNGGAAASLPSCDARTRPPVPAALPSRRI